MAAVSGEWARWFELIERCAGMQKSISARIALKLQQQNTTAGASAVSFQQKTEAAGTASTKLNNRGLEKRCMLWWVSISAVTLRQGFFYCKQHDGTDPSCLVSAVQAGGGGVIVWGLLTPYYQLSIVKNPAHLSAVADHVHPFLCQFLSSIGCTRLQSLNHRKPVSWTPDHVADVWIWIHSCTLNKSEVRLYKQRSA